MNIPLRNNEMRQFSPSPQHRINITQTSIPLKSKKNTSCLQIITVPKSHLPHPAFIKHLQRLSNVFSRFLGDEARSIMFCNHQSNLIESDRQHGTECRDCHRSIEGNIFSMLCSSMLDEGLFLVSKAFDFGFSILWGGIPPSSKARQ